MIVLETIAVAFSMFSAIPMPQFSWNERNMRYSLCAFPLVGAVIATCMFFWGKLCLLLSLPDILRGAGLVEGNHFPAHLPAVGIAKQLVFFQESAVQGTDSFQGFHGMPPQWVSGTRKKSVLHGLFGQHRTIRVVGWCMDDLV